MLKLNNMPPFVMVDYRTVYIVPWGKEWIFENKQIRIAFSSEAPFRALFKNRQKREYGGRWIRKIEFSTPSSGYPLYIDIIFGKSLSIQRSMPAGSTEGTGEIAENDLVRLQGRIPIEFKRLMRRTASQLRSEQEDQEDQQKDQQEEQDDANPAAVSLREFSMDLRF